MNDTCSKTLSGKHKWSLYIRKYYEIPGKCGHGSCPSGPPHVEVKRIRRKYPECIFCKCVDDTK